MNFIEALKVMKQGGKVKLPSWGGYWYWDKEKETVMIQCRPQDSEKESFSTSEKLRELNTLFKMWLLMNGCLPMKATVLY